MAASILLIWGCDVLINFQIDVTSVIVRVKIRQDTTGAAPGKGFTGLLNTSPGLIVSTIADSEAVPTPYTSAGSTIQTIPTLGQYTAPAAGSCRLQLVDNVNHPGLVELQFSNARFAVVGSKSLTITIIGVSGMMDCDVTIPLLAVDPYNGEDFGLPVLAQLEGSFISDESIFSAAALQFAPGGGSNPVVVGGYLPGQDPATLVFAEAVDGGLNFLQIQRLEAAVLLGRSSGLPEGQPVYLSVNGSIVRVSGISMNGNRTALVLNPN